MVRMRFHHRQSMPEFLALFLDVPTFVTYLKDEAKDLFQSGASSRSAGLRRERAADLGSEVSRAVGTTESGKARDGGLDD